jgi:ABC-2 type transport system ATP-binding protein
MAAEGSCVNGGGPVIAFEHVSKQYRRYGKHSLREAISDLGRRLVPVPRGQTREAEVLWAVRDLSLTIHRARTWGIIGPNGAGKTTTLKLLSRVTRPTSGRVQVNGRVSALIELGAGFHPDLTGRENVFLNGTILGMRRQEIRRGFDAIVDFADLAPFIDTPVKYYSSGMYARLGFAVAAHTNPDVLLVDEVLAVGDYAFQQRCYKRMRSLQAQGTTILLVSHNLAAIADMCEEVVVLNHGQAVFQGSAPHAIAEYASVIRQSAISKEQIRVGQDAIAERLMTHEARFVSVRLTDISGRPVEVVAPGDCVRLLATVEFYADAVHPHFSCFVRDEQGHLIYDQTTLWQSAATPSYHKGQHATVAFELQMNVVKGLYGIGIDIHYEDLSCYYDRLETAATVFVDGEDGAKGVAQLDCRFVFDGPSLGDPVVGK